MLLLQERQKLHRFLRRREGVKHALETFYEDVGTCVSVTDVTYKGYDVVGGGQVNDR